MRRLVFVFYLFAAMMYAGEHDAGDAKNPRATDKIAPLADGLVFDGVRIHCDTGNSLRGFDVAESKQIWVTGISSFWSRARIVAKEIDGAKQWMLELHPGAHIDHGAELREYRALRTGKVINLSGPPPAGELLGPAQVIGVSRSALPRKSVTLISTQENMDAFWARAHGPREAAKPSFDIYLLQPDLDVPGGVRREVMPAPQIDFTQNVALIYHLGDCFNTTGMNQRGIWDDGKRILLRLSRSGYQTMGQAVLRRTGEIFILPRREGRHYEVEENMQNLIRGPEIWQRTELFPPPKGGAEEIAEFAPEYRPAGEKLPPGFKRVIQQSKTEEDDDTEIRINHYVGRKSYDYYLLGKRTVLHGPYKLEKKDGDKWISVAEGTFADGQQDGVWQYRATGTQFFEPSRVPKDSQRIHITFDRDVPHGPYEVTNATGVKVVVGAYDNGVANGTWTLTHDDGTKTIYPFVRGLYHGDLQRISAAGDITWKQSYEMGKKKE